MRKLIFDYSLLSRCLIETSKGGTSGAIFFYGGGGGGFCVCVWGGGGGVRTMNIKVHIV